jgi:transposase
MARKYRRRFARLDSTNFSLEGAYQGFGDSPEEAPQLIKVAHGHSKQHRPDLKQFTLSMMNSGAAGFPCWAESLNGNASDKKSFHETIARVKAFQKEIGDTEPFCWAADSALYGKDQLLKKKAGCIWITRVPESIKEAKEVVSRPDEDFQWQELPDGYKIASMESNYGDVPQRWLLVFSQQAYDREVKTLNKKIKKEHESLKKALWHLSNEEFACAHDAEKKCREVLKKVRFHSAEFEVKTEYKFSNPGRPKAGVQPNRTIVRIISTIKEKKEAIIAARATRGRFILATNDLDKTRLPDEQILKEYKDLQKVERGFRFLKDPWFLLDKIFLKTPNRIAALMAVMALCLMVYTVAEYELRQRLKRENLTLPNQLKKEVNNPTMRWVFKMMDGITVVTMTAGGVVQTVVANITKLREKIIRLFGKFTQEIYSILPEPELI